MCSVQGAIEADYPGSSSFVTSVGGSFVQAPTTDIDQKEFTPQTKLCAMYQCATGSELYPCNFASTSWTTGSSFGCYNQVPSWQQSFVNDYYNSGVYLPNNPFNRFGRATPDLMTPGHNSPVFINGVLQPVDGTSFSSPVAAGFVALWNDKRLLEGKPTLGFANPLLYKLAKKHTGLFTNNFTGNSHATESLECSQDWGFQTSNSSLVYNLVSGLGSPNFGMIYQYI
jgi:tripeptidyl-peptidase-1